MHKYLSIYAIFIGIVIIFWFKLRDFLVRTPLSLMISEIPNVEPLYNKCMDIYMVRSSPDHSADHFQLEVRMYAQLVHLFRSPSHLIEVTRPPELLKIREQETGHQPDNAQMSS